MSCKCAFIVTYILSVVIFDVVEAGEASLHAAHIYKRLVVPQLELFILYLYGHII